MPLYAMEAILAEKRFIVLAIRSKPLIKQFILSVFHRIDAIRNDDILGGDQKFREKWPDFLK